MSQSSGWSSQPPSNINVPSQQRQPGPPPPQEQQQLHGPAPHHFSQQHHRDHHWYGHQHQPVYPQQQSSGFVPGGVYQDPSGSQQGFVGPQDYSQQQQQGYYQQQSSMSYGFHPDSQPPQQQQQQQQQQGGGGYDPVEYPLPHHHQFHQVGVFHGAASDPYQMAPQHSEFIQQPAHQWTGKSCSPADKGKGKGKKRGKYRGKEGKGAACEHRVKTVPPVEVLRSVPCVATLVYYPKMFFSRAGDSVPAVVLVKPARSGLHRKCADTFYLRPGDIEQDGYNTLMKNLTVGDYVSCTVELASTGRYIPIEAAICSEADVSANVQDELENVLRDSRSDPLPTEAVAEKEITSLDTAGLKIIRARLRIIESPYSTRSQQRIALSELYITINDLLRSQLDEQGSIGPEFRKLLLEDLLALPTLWGIVDIRDGQPESADFKVYVSIAKLRSLLETYEALTAADIAQLQASYRWLQFGRDSSLSDEMKSQVREELKKHKKNTGPAR